MADPANFEVIAYQRKPGHWRASFTPKGMTLSGLTIRSAVTADDYASEADAMKAATREIKLIGSE
jgi:hypothetical protein